MVERDIRCDVPVAGALIVLPMAAIFYAILRSFPYYRGAPNLAEAGVALLGGVAAALPFVAGMAWHYRGGKAARAYVVMEAGILVFASFFFGDAFLGLVGLALPFAAPLVVLALWEITVDDGYVASRAHALGGLATVSVVVACVAMLMALLASRIDVVAFATLALTVNVAVMLRVRREKRALLARFDAWLDEVRDGRHESFAVAPATITRSDLPAYPNPETACLATEREWILHEGAPILRVGR